MNRTRPNKRFSPYPGMLKIEIQNVDSIELDENLMITAAEKSYKHVAEKLAECTIRIVGSNEGQQLNHDYRQKDKPTNVLSFSYDDYDPESEVEYLGDIVLCYPVVLKESEEQGKLPKNHFAHLIVHGILHLCGFDHEKKAEAEQMEQLEIQILAKLQIDNPYLSA